MNVDALREQIQSARKRSEQLRERAGSEGAAELLPEALEELRTAYEELRVAEEELRRQNQELAAARLVAEERGRRYQDLFESAPDGYLVTDRIGTILQANQAAGALLGGVPRALVGKPLVVLLAPGERAVFHAELERLIREGRPQQWTLAFQPRGSGASTGGFLSLSVTIARYDARQPVTLRWLLRDVTEQKRAQEQILASSAELERRVAERTADLERVNQDKDQLLAREKAARAKVEAAEQRLAFLSRANEALTASLDLQERLQQVTRLAVPDLADHCRVDLIGEDGRVQWAAEGPTAAADAAPAVIPATIAWTAEPAHEANAPHAALSPLAESAVAGDPEGTQAGRTTLYLPLRVSDRMIGMLTLDRTDPHHAYLPEEVAHADYFARRAAVAIDNARLHQRLRDADRRKDEFLAMLAHELRNPLGSLRNASHLLRLASTDPDRVQWCQALVERQVVYLSRLAEDLLDVSRITRGQLRLDCERIDLRDVAGRAVETTGPFLKERRHQLTTNLPDEPVFLEADATRLEQVLVNLLINAGRYTDPGGQITVVVERHEQGVVVRVRDNGVGIDGDALPRIFDLFMQADAASRHARSGLGLGLSLVRSLVEMHGGQVSAHSAGPGQGSEFMVYLPLGSPSE